MKLIADLHFHSKYSRAVSPQMVLSEIARWACKKGIDLVTTADFTHPLWFRELKANLKEMGEGIYRLRDREKPLFIFGTEISSIYSQNGKLRRIHSLVVAPGLEEAAKIGVELAKRGNVMSDGRPIFGLSAAAIAELILGISPKSLIIPAHAWTPHFALYGSESGFDSLGECFGDMSRYIYAIETGLSSDPAMNWKIGELDSRSIVSFSDAHSGSNLGREATVFEAEDIKKLRYEDIRRAVVSEYSENQGARESETHPKIAYTIEFYPEEGKYHFTGHRNCGVRHSPDQTKELGTVCPFCGKRLTVGVMHRVEQIAARELKTQNLKLKTDEFGARWIGYGERPPYVMLVPLLEILSESLSSTQTSQKVVQAYENLIEKFGGEFKVLLGTNIEEVAKISGPRVAEGLRKVRSGEIMIEPGYDGEYGTVRIWPSTTAVDEKQTSLF